MIAGANEDDFQIDQTVLELNGADWALDWSLRDLSEAYDPDQEPSLTCLRLVDFDLDTFTAGIVIQVLKRHAVTLKELSFTECTEHIDLVVTVALTCLDNLTSLKIVTGRLSTKAFDPCAKALGVGLQFNNTLRSLSLQAGSKVFFTLSTPGAQALADGLEKNCMLKSLTIAGCRFAETNAVSNMARGLQSHRFLKFVTFQYCFMGNGHPLGDDAVAELIRGLEHNSELETLNLAGNKCLQKGIVALSKLLDRTTLRDLDLSCQYIDSQAEQEDDDDDNLESMNLSYLVAALGRARHLERIELRFNKLNDEDMAYLAAALTHNTSITYVGLGNNQISTTGLSILASRVPNMRGLKELVLTNNSYTPEGTMELARALEENTVLQTIHLDGPDLSDPTSFRLVHHYADLNWAGRRYLDRKNYHDALLPAFWALLLARTTQLVHKEDGKGRQVDVIYCLLRHGPALFPM